ncbi:hypothetical protein BH09PAT2_BH09PAT2_00970 [soil metagenome]
MKAFFIATTKGEEEFRAYYHLLYEEIKKLGYSHVSNFIENTADDFYTKMKEGRNQHVQFYNEMIEGIQSADICIFEASTPSLAVGFLIQRALEYSKPTIVLYYKDNIVYFLSGIEDEKLIRASYDEKDYKKVLKKVLEQAREKRDKRFNFFLSPKLLNYLEQSSNGRGVTKSKLLRDMIVQHMREEATTVKE